VGYLRGGKSHIAYGREYKGRLAGTGFLQVSVRRLKTLTEI
jgi:hypothetical protein